MKKAYVFMGMLLGVSFILNNFTLGFASGFFDLVALFSLRWKHFILYNILSLPLAIVNYLNYSAFYGLLFSSMHYLPVTLVNVVFSYQWGLPAVIGGIWIFSVFSSYRAFWEIKAAHNISKWLKIKQTIYNLRPRTPRPPSHLFQRIQKHRITIFRILLIVNCATLTGGFLYLSYFVWTNYPMYHEAWELVKNCNFHWTGHSFASNMEPMIRHGIYYRDPVLVCTSTLPK